MQFLEIKHFTFSKTKQKVAIKSKCNVKIVEVTRIFLAAPFALQYGNW